MNQKQFEDVAKKVIPLVFESLRGEGLDPGETVLMAHFVGASLIGLARGVDPRYADLNIEDLISKISSRAFVVLRDGGFPK